MSEEDDRPVWQRLEEDYPPVKPDPAEEERIRKDIDGENTFEDEGMSEVPDKE